MMRHPNGTPKFRNGTRDRKRTAAARTRTIQRKRDRAAKRER